ncbi:uncharacterized protein LTR77_007619 [Saxophila tyrrhenica]|uniref:Integral membrane protein n=1 Tax=Saxophila tyrrhenica TaxID=1690608 RepID=A0AAV9P335_9PEZI|nr:hypothetical protein LTR77_007619 [Saxophila tyrrhenica]
MAPTIQYLRYATTVIATIFIGFGINSFVNPSLAISFFGLPYPDPEPLRQITNVLLAAEGIRDVFIGLAMYASYFGDNRVLGWITVAAGATAGADGVICKMMVGTGEWNHWGYAPILVAIGGALALG